MRPGDHRREAGFTYVALLFALAVLGIGLASLGESWAERARRDKEEELIMVGVAYVRAIGRYYDESPGEHRYPLQLQDLLEDRRFVDTRRYLRQVYVDPVHLTGQWRLIRAPDGGVKGVASQSETATLRRRTVELPGSNSASGDRYSDWLFVYTPSTTTKHEEGTH